jgi:hypothetical protein
MPGAQPTSDSEKDAGLKRSTWTALLGLGPLALYAVLALFYFGISPASLPKALIGEGGDPKQSVWFLAWLPHALLHGENPFFTSAVFQPGRVNLAWSTTMPTLALVSWPITRLFGPIASFNLLTLAAPTLASLSCFYLARSLFGKTAPAIVAGYLFGFSPYMLGQLIGHLNLDFTALVPPMALVTLAFLRAQLSAAKFILWFSLLVILQFGISTEIMASTVFFGGVLWIISYWMKPNLRPRLRKLVGAVGCSGVIAAVVLSPYLIAIIKGFSSLPSTLNSPTFYSADLVNYLIPTQTTLIGGAVAARISQTFSGNPSEQGAYLGLAVLCILALAARSGWKVAKVRVLLITLIITILCALGPELHILGREVLPLPWKLILHVPLLRSALPTRFSMFTWLIASVLVAYYLAEASYQLVVRVSLGALAIASVVPNLAYGAWFEEAHVPRLFLASPSSQRTLLGKRNLFILPYGNGNAMLWQAADHFSFKMAGGYIGAADIPVLYRNHAALLGATQSTLALGALTGRLVCNLLQTFQVGRVVIPPGIGPQLLGALKPDAAGVQKYGDLTLVATKHRLNRCSLGSLDLQEFQMMLRATRSFLASGKPLSSLTPPEVERSGLLPAGFSGYQLTASNSNWTKLGGWIGPWGSGSFGIGIVGNGPAVAKIIATYVGQASRIYFPYPNILQKSEPLSVNGQLLMIFPISDLSEDRKASLSSATSLTG